MNKLLLLLLLMLLMNTIKAVTLEVSLDGSYPYTTIQSAIDASSDNDTVLVYPGRYFENIDFIGKSITVCSEYINTPDWSVVESTIIDGNQLSSCVIAIRGEENAILIGFTITNGSGYSLPVNPDWFGGGIYLKLTSTLAVQHCIIEYNSSYSSGGIRCADNSSISLSGNIIRNNKSIHQGGGIGVNGASVFFDSANPNSIYNNYGDVQDIFLYNVTCNDIVLDTLSVNMTEPDGFFVSYYAPPLNTNPIPSISVQNAYFSQIDADLYVSPGGDDNNDGLTPATALKTIAFANRLIQPDEQNPNTVFLLPGTYGRIVNNQIFPIACQSNTKMLGTGEIPTDVVIGDDWGINLVLTSNAENVEIGNLSVTLCDEMDDTAFSINSCNNLYIHDIDIYNNLPTIPGMLMMFCTNTIYENVSIHDIENTDEMITAIYTYECSDIVFNNTIVNNIISNCDMGFVSVMNFDDSDVTVNNTIITNNQRTDSSNLVQYSNTSPSSPGGNLELNNFLMYNNTFASGGESLVIVSRYDQIHLNNLTVAHNNGPEFAVRFIGDIVMRNSILYNPECGGELHLWAYPPSDPNPIPTIANVDYCLIRNGETGVVGAANVNNTLIWGTHNIDTNPLFRGDVEGNIPIGDPRWVQLSEFSPCVNTGTPDTLGMNLPANDITGNPRIWNNIIDMGAHEYNPT
ncbi:MAG: right-handed parallel beta-helix repeat-containing protein, partial [Candidatus Cloacimonetes bacterium]|nr:right-handed parallel beta-helix repeat-containing protein [Candidatus Cloacimonadota bacterium]